MSPIEFSCAQSLPVFRILSLFMELSIALETM